jgi:hypothetical protein
MYCRLWLKARLAVKKQSPVNVTPSIGRTRLFCGGNPFDFRFVIRKKRVRFPASKPPLA